MKHLTKHVLILLGILSLIAGFIGVFLPIMPTAPFILLSAYLFSKSSERFHLWLLHHPTLGPPIHEWREERVIRPIAKLLACGGIICSYVLTVLLTALPLWLYLVIAALLLPLVIYLSTRPNYPSKPSIPKP